MKKLAKGFNTAAQDLYPGPLSRESDALPLNHGALQTSWSPQFLTLSYRFNYNVHILSVGFIYWAYYFCHTACNKFNQVLFIGHIISVIQLATSSTSVAAAAMEEIVTRLPITPTTWSVTLAVSLVEIR